MFIVRHMHTDMFSVLSTQELAMEIRLYLDIAKYYLGNSSSW